MTFAVVPAGGLSVRMGRPKLLLPLGGRTVIEHVVAGLRQAAIDPIVIVLGPHVRELAALAEKAGASVHVLPEPTADMRATVEAGLRWLEERLHPAPEDDWLLVPADHPTLDPAVVRQLRAARQAAPAASIFVPTWTGRRGHPTLIAWKHVAGIRELPVGVGINAYVRDHAQDIHEVAASSSNILVDLDTPDDYEALQRRWPN